MKILIVDDQLTMRNSIKSALKQLGYSNTESAEDGIGALKKLLTDSYDLVLADWNMPGMSGISLLRAVRNNPSICKVKFLLLTAEAKKENVIEAIQAGVDSYITKPFTAQTLNEKIDMLFKQ